MDLTTYELRLPPGFPYPDIPEDNALTIARVELGRRLFYDPILSRDSSVSCASCHRQSLAFSDDEPVSRGVDGRRGFRNAPTLANVAYHTLMNKDGGVPRLDLQALVPIEDANEMDMSMHEVTKRLQRRPAYVRMSQLAYGRDPDAFVVTRALAAFQRTLISGDSRFDQHFYQGLPVLNESEMRGLKLFFSEEANCSRCHSGFNFTHNDFENNGLYLDYRDDPGRRRVTILEEDVGKFKVPTLRNIALTAPYMHDGSLSSLEAVIEHYNSGGSGHVNQNPLIRPLDLSDQEKADIVAFLHTLTDSTFLTDPAFEVR